MLARGVRNPYRPGTESHQAFHAEQLGRRLREPERSVARLKSRAADRAQQRKIARYLRRELRILPAREAAYRHRAELRTARRESRLPSLPRFEAPIESITPAEALPLLRAELTPYQPQRLGTLSREQQLDLADIYRRYPAGPPPKPGLPGGVALDLSGFKWWLLYRAYGFQTGVS